MNTSFINLKRSVAHGKFDVILLWKLSRQNPCGTDRLAKILTVYLTFVLASCATSRAPERPIYRGSDTVSSVEAVQLLGSWAVTELNPFPGRSPQTTIIQYLADGRVKGLMNLPVSDGRTEKPLEFELHGKWILDRDIVSHQNMQLKSTTESVIGTMLSNAVNGQGNLSGKANIYEVSGHRIIMVGTDGAAMEYVRQKQ